MLSIINSAALVGIEACPVQVEVNTGQSGEPRTVMVGLPDAAVKESQDRVAGALANSGYRLPETRTTVNLAPGDLRKEGPLYDVPIAIGLLAATGQIDACLTEDYLFAGELSLSGRLRPVRGALALAVLARKQGAKGIVLPMESAEEAALVSDIPVYGAETLSQIARHFSGNPENTDYLERIDPEASPYKQLPGQQMGADGESRDILNMLDFADVKGQHAVRRAVEVAVAGGHNLLMIGPPGSGKSMIAKRIPTIMPQPTFEEYLEILSVQSVAGLSRDPENRCFTRPFRSPHHTISNAGLLGGGQVPGPGEISLAHHGVLFLDELPEFRRSTLEVLRQPLEDGEVTISRSAGKVTLPCGFMLVAAMNPTPGGYAADDARSASTSAAEIERYRAKISGPLLDRMDIHVDAPAVRLEELRDDRPGESSATIRQRIIQCRKMQTERFAGSPTPCNARMHPSQLREHCKLGAAEGKLIERAMLTLGLSARAYDKVLKVSRTIADLEGSATIEVHHLMEATGYRNLDRQQSPAPQLVAA